MYSKKTHDDETYSPKRSKLSHDLTFRTYSCCARATSRKRTKIGSLFVTEYNEKTLTCQLDLCIGGVRHYLMFLFFTFIGVGLPQLSVYSWKPAALCSRSHMATLSSADPRICQQARPRRDLEWETKRTKGSSPPTGMASAANPCWASRPLGFVRPSVRCSRSPRPSQDRGNRGLAVTLHFRQGGFIF